ncbi:hypothetical protein [Mesorhizobium sp. WSM4884]|uniref:hypothetical protein n=1 Tax=Mesorhizobium sp. WSM4884 TaxID=3038542 RepID=UPI0024167496|nr:hypothetical protein [Mesorhizobium sp. WSM4884]MDG4883002.1 hypothetical protein [Mesorhizobium sp. WSM4884]
MLKTILAASALTIGLATAAMAQSAGHMGSGTRSGAAGDTNGGSSQTVVPNSDTVDPGTTGSISGGPTYDDGMNSNADRNCAPGPQGAQSDASNLSPGTTAPTVNDKNCGK